MAHTSTSPPRKASILYNVRGEPDQLLIIQWAGSILLSLAIGWNAVVDAYLGHDLTRDVAGVLIFEITRFKQIGSDTLILLLGMAGGAGSLYNWRRSQDRYHDLEKAKMQLPQSPQTVATHNPIAYASPSKQRPVVASVNMLDTDPGDPDARL